MAELTTSEKESLFTDEITRLKAKQEEIISSCNSSISEAHGIINKEIQRRDTAQAVLDELNKKYPTTTEVK